jgi:hypothetical protein
MVVKTKIWLRLCFDSKIQNQNFFAKITRTIISAPGRGPRVHEPAVDDVPGHAAQVDRREPRPRPGADSTNLRFGQMFFLDLRSKLCPKIADKKVSSINGQNTSIQLHKKTKIFLHYFSFLVPLSFVRKSLFGQFSPSIYAQNFIKKLQIK